MKQRKRFTKEQRLLHALDRGKIFPVTIQAASTQRVVRVGPTFYYKKVEGNICRWIHPDDRDYYHEGAKQYSYVTMEHVFMKVFYKAWLIEEWDIPKFLNHLSAAENKYLILSKKDFSEKLVYAELEGTQL